MSQVHTRQMGRLTAAGVKGDLDDALAILARLKALHFIDYDGSEDGLSLGTPASKADDISRVLNKVRAAAAQVDASGPGDAVPAGPVREAIVVTYQQRSMHFLTTLVASTKLKPLSLHKLRRRLLSEWSLHLE